MTKYCCLFVKSLKFISFHSEISFSFSSRTFSPTSTSVDLTQPNLMQLILQHFDILFVIQAKTPLEFYLPKLITTELIIFSKPQNQNLQS